MIAERAHRPWWGWKDPRTSLFLSFWHKLLPNARFLFVYRHPIEVLLSLLRRGEFDSHPSLMPALSAWLKYNSSVLAFYDQNVDRCLLVHIKGLVQSSAKFTHLIKKKLQVTSGPSEEAFTRIYCGSELKQTPFAPDTARALNRICPPLLALYQQLNRKADLPIQETGQHSQASTLLSPLVQLTETLPDASSLPIQQGVLQLLVTLLEPQLAEQMLVKFNESGKQTQRKVDYLWMHAQHVQRQNVELEQELKLRAAKIEALTGELAAVRGTSPTDAILKNSQGSNRA